MKTREQVLDLKQRWFANPDWDLASTEGFEEYAEELEVFVKESDAMVQEFVRKRKERAAKMTAAGLHGFYGISDVNALFDYLLSLENRIAAMEAKGGA